MAITIKEAAIERVRVELSTTHGEPLIIEISENGFVAHTEVNSAGNPVGSAVSLTADEIWEVFERQSQKLVSCGALKIPLSERKSVKRAVKKAEV